MDNLLKWFRSKFLKFLLFLSGAKQVSKIEEFDEPVQKVPVRILIAYTGENLEPQDISEILAHGWYGRIPQNVKITSNPLTSTAWTSDKQFAVAWTMWQQMLQYKNGEHPYWEDYKTQAYKGTTIRTKQRFYIEIYYKDFQENEQKSTVSKIESGS
jgi:hypothetical protein